MTQVKFKNPGLIVFDPAVRDILYKQRQQGNENEKAAVLGGYYSPDGVWHVTAAMPSSSKNKAGRYWVLRDRPSAQLFINMIYKETSGKVNYLGEWHTHPIEIPVPSPDDRSMISGLLKTSVLEIDFLISVIVGNAGCACCWVQTKKGDKILVETPQYFDLQSGKLI